MTRFLFGPVSAIAPPAPFREQGRALPAERFVSFATQSGTRADLELPFDATWDECVARLGEVPRAILVWLGYTTVPDWVWTAPVPVIALAMDWTLLWHCERHTLPLADAVLTDTAGVRAFQAAGLNNVFPGCLFGLGPDWMAEASSAIPAKDIDVLFIGNLNPVLQVERRAWLARIARLPTRHRVVIASGIQGADYRRWMRRAKVVINRSARGEANQRAFEAVAAGAVLVNEGSTLELDQYLVRNEEWVPYAENDFEVVVDALLADEARRQRIVTRAGTRIAQLSFEQLLNLALDRLEWEDLQFRAQKRSAPPRFLSTAGRMWMWAASSDRARPAIDDPHARGLFAANPAEAEPHFRLAARSNRVSRLALAETLVSLDRIEEAAQEFQELLLSLERPLMPQEADTVPAPGGFDRLRAAWENAGWQNAGNTQAEILDKTRLLQARCHERLAVMTGDPEGFHRAAQLCPADPTLSAAYGCTLALTGRKGDAVVPLQRAVMMDPFDVAAARAWYQACLDLGDLSACAAIAEHRRRLHRVAPQLVPAEAYFAPPLPPGLVRITLDQFQTRFGRPDTSEAITGNANPLETVLILTLAVSQNARRLLELGPADGRMAANLARFTAADAIVVSVGPPTHAVGSSQQHAANLLPGELFADPLERFGLGHKVRMIRTDTTVLEWNALAPLDLALLASSAVTFRADSLGAYQALRPGGLLIWTGGDNPGSPGEAPPAALSLGLPERITQVAGTGIAFLIKGEGIGGTAGPESAMIRVHWVGEFEPIHSLAGVNRAIATALLARGQRVEITRLPADPAIPTVTLDPALVEAKRLPMSVDVVVRHAWPPDFTPPAGSTPFVVMQPWEFGRLPKAWVESILQSVDEVWACSQAVARCYVASGIPAERVQVIPYGVDLDLFRPGVEPLPLRTTKSVKLLFVGGLLPRKGFELLLAAYRRAFTIQDDVVLIVKGMGTETFYRGQGDPDWRTKWAADPQAPAIEVVEQPLSDEEMPRLYAACDVLVHPYRGEGFGLPVLEAMACRLPVAVTAGGSTEDFVPPAAGWKIPASVRYFEKELIDRWPTAGQPWWLEPDPEALVGILREIVASPGERLRRGRAARAAAQAYPWSRMATEIEARVRILRTRPAIRLRSERQTPVPLPATPRNSADCPVSLTMIVRNEAHNLPACLGPLRDLVGEMIVVDTGSTDDTRQVAASFGAKVSEFPWIDNFAAARNAALERATRPWAFWMDADDRLDPDNARKLATLFASLREDELAAYVVKCICVADAPGGTETIVDHIRIFRRHPDVRWRFRVHEQILPSLRQVGADVRWSDVAVRHVGYIDPALRSRKLDRDTRLLEQELAEHPDDPFALFNLGAVLHERSRWLEAVPVLEKSLSRSHPRDSIVRKAFALLVQCHTKAGQRAQASKALNVGLGHYPADAELLFLAGGLAREEGNRTEAERIYRELIVGNDTPHFGSVDASLRGCKARHNLGLILSESGRVQEALAQWREGVQADPYFLPSWLAIAECSSRIGDRIGEVEALRKVVKLKPDWADLSKRLQELRG